MEAQTATVAPSSSALETATVIPRSLNEPVGFEPLVLEQHAAAGQLRDPRRRAAAASSPRPASTTGVASRDREPVAIALDQPRHRTPPAQAGISIRLRSSSTPGSRIAITRSPGSQPGVADRDLGRGRRG